MGDDISSGDYFRQHGERGYSEKQAAKRQSRLIKDEGYAASPEGRAVIRQYLPALKKRIADDRSKNRRDKELWSALIAVDNLEERLLDAGLTVAMSTQLGADNDGKSALKTALCIGYDLKQTTDKIATKVGQWGVAMLLCLPIFALDENNVLVITPTTELRNLLDEAFDNYVARHARLMPLRELPEPWTDVWKGGVPYNPDWPVRVPLVKRPVAQDVIHKAIRKGMMGRLPWVLDAINALQKVPFAINEPVFKVALKMQPVVPPMPHWLEKYGNKVPTWLAKQAKPAKDWWTAKQKTDSWYLDMTMARILANRKQFFVPLKMDFRGRLNAIPLFNFQRGDHVRGLFYFAEGKPIGTEGLYWLKAHVASLADDDEIKPSRLNPEQRVAWTNRNMPRLLAIGEAVRRGDVPEGIELIDDPIQFIAACHELALAGDNPNFPTRLPVTFDGRCNGLQHLCALTRSDDAKFANLLATEAAEDFYQMVADYVNRNLNRWYVKFKVDKDKNGKDEFKLKNFPTKVEADRFAKTVVGAVTGYINIEIDRKLVKQPVLSYFYAATIWGMTEQIIKVLEERNKSTSGASKIAAAIYDAVEKIAPDAKAVRLFLESLSDLYADHNTMLRWYNLLGFPVINLSTEPEIKTISKKINGRRRRVNVAVGETNKVNKRKARQSVIANFTHSLDACHLQMVACHVDRRGIPMVSVHDSYGCLAPDAPRFREAILWNFYALHSASLVLHNLLEQAKRDLPPGTKLPELPKWGELDLSKIRQSNAFD